MVLLGEWGILVRYGFGLGIDYVVVKYLIYDGVLFIVLREENCREVEKLEVGRKGEKWKNVSWEIWSELL